MPNSAIHQNGDVSKIESDWLPLPTIRVGQFASRTSVCCFMWYDVVWQWKVLTSIPSAQRDISGNSGAAVSISRMLSSVHGSTLLGSVCFVPCLSALAPLLVWLIVLIVITFALIPCKLSACVQHY